MAKSSPKPSDHSPSERAGSSSPIRAVAKSLRKTVSKSVGKMFSKMAGAASDSGVASLAPSPSDSASSPVHPSLSNPSMPSSPRFSSVSRTKRERTESNLHSTESPSKSSKLSSAPHSDPGPSHVKKESQPDKNCPYLGTINRHLLDFDFEKVCSITLSNIHVYACLICGKYFQGRGKTTHCYSHALEECHYLFMNLEDCNVYCIPENYLVEDASLDDIKHFLKPVYSRRDVELLKTQVTYGKALDGTDFIPGCIGLNNLKKTDYFNVVIQLMCVVTPLRDVFLLFDVNKVQPPDAVITTLVQLVRKVFNTKNFKGIVSPHEFVQAVGVASNGVYKIGVQSDPVSLLSWLLTRIHQRLQNRNTKESVVTKAFGGELLIRTLRGSRWETERKPFRMLTLDVPEAPIFKDSMDSNTIPQVPIFDLLAKYDGEKETRNAQGEPTKYKLSKLPEYLVLVIKRFTMNNFFMEKNPTIVSFPMKNLDLSDYVMDQDGNKAKENTKYDLVCNICHEGPPTGGTYKVHVFHEPSNNWFQMEDLLVTSVLPQQVALTESYVQVYRRQQMGEEDMFAP